MVHKKNMSELFFLLIVAPEKDTSATVKLRRKKDKQTEEILHSVSHLMSLVSIFYFSLSCKDTIMESYWKVLQLPLEVYQNTLLPC